MQASLIGLRQLSDYLQASLGPAQAEGWLSPAQLFAADSPKLGELIDQAQAAYRTDSPAIIAGVILSGYQWIIIVPALACYLSQQRVPNLEPENIRVRYSSEADRGFANEIAYCQGRFLALPDDPAAAHPDAIIMPDRATMRDQLRLSIEAHVEWVLDRLQGVIHARSEPLWRAVADRCAGTILWLGQELNGHFGGPDRVEAEVEDFVRGPNSALRNSRTGILKLTYQDRPHLFLKRGACCYAFRTESHGYCFTCPLQSAEERERQLLAYLRSQVESDQA